jgi:hypothetical protein
MPWIEISYKIINLFRECKHNNVAYMLCMLNGTLLGRYNS